jgi:LPPG:FO 2-phospho-L-lactate transferase
MLMGLVVALGGGVGAARFLRGLVRVVSPADLVIVGNTGDDVEMYGLHISPDLDILMYTLAGIVDETKGWGIAGDTFECLQTLEALGLETWFKLGDKDLGVQIFRTQLLRNGMTLSQAVAELCRMLGVEAKLLPMSNESVRTKILSRGLRLEFQEYFVKRGAADEVEGVLYEGSHNANPSPGIVEAIGRAERIIVCPSNPILSIAPILSIPTIRSELKRTSARVVSISPIVGGKAIKGPAASIMANLGLEVSAFGVAKYYEDFLDHIVIDNADEQHRARIENLGIRVTVTDTIMKDVESAIYLARTAMEVE